MSPDVQFVLSRYSAVVSRLHWVPLIDSGGFSGAALWCGVDSNATRVFALKRWPQAMMPERLERIHDWMTRAVHLDFVPGVVRTDEGRTLVQAAGHTWDVCRWMPGEPVLAMRASRVTNAATAVAALHRTWPALSRHVPCPSVLNRLRILDEFRTSARRGSPAAIGSDSELTIVLNRSAEFVSLHAHSAESELRHWNFVPLPVRPCIRDLRAEHVLFVDESVSGIIDYGAMAVDHPATDLARLLGDCASGDADSVGVAVEVYRANGGEPTVSPDLVRLLAWTGALCSLIGWLRRADVNHGLGTTPVAAAARITSLMTRLEKSRRV